MRKSLWASVLLVAIVLTVSSACKAPAEFEVTSLDVAPPQVTVGDTVRVAAEVKNIGGSEGTYTAILTVDGVEIETKDVAVAPGATEAVTFSVVKEEAGSYQIAMDEMSSSLVVKEKEPTLIAKEIELRHDDGEAYQYLVSVDGGWLVDFLPPPTPFTVRKIRLFGAQSSSGRARTFEVEIWDKDRKILYNQTYPSTEFPIGKAAPGREMLAVGGRWVELEVPNIEVSDRFYVHMWNGPKFAGIHLGADDSIENERSAITVRTGGITEEVETWSRSNFCLCWFFYDYDQSKVNWMIRVVGTIMVPEE